ncbi:MAG TPA: ATP-binding protein [Chthoniobacterales bacterium]|nr:ATP-binding protein [Chthoniobacterales bacterium]
MKQRIFLGLAPIFVLIVVMGAYAVLLFTKLGVSVDVILRENFRSVLACQQMKESAERMDSALFFSLVGEDARGRELFTKNVESFEKGLREESANITLPSEGELAKSIQESHTAYIGQSDAFWQSTDPKARHAMYFSQLLPQFTKIKDTAQKIIDINQQNMVQADRNARELGERSTRYMVLASIIGIAAAIFFATRLQKSILEPINALTAVSKELGDGKLDQIVPVASRDELGQLADAFNKMAAKLRTYRQVTGDQILLARQMTEITFSAFPDPIIAMAPDGVINFTNPAANHLFPKLGSVNKLPDSVQEQVKRVLEGGADYLPTSFEKTAVVRFEDKEVFLLPRVIGIRDEGGALFGAAVILQDVTRLRLLDEVKGNLVSTVSHELKTPLTSVRMGLHLLLEERIGPLNAKQTELLLAGREESERLLEMINDLLDLAKLESGHLNIDEEGVPAGDLVRTAAAELESVVDIRGMHLVSRIGESLPRVKVDARQIAHVFTNLVSNAVKHSPRGEDVVLQAVQNGRMIRFSVIDQGKGVLPQLQSQIFDRFFRVPGEESSGAGLGLAIAREIVIAHGGGIGVHSDGRNGSEFYFDLPIATEVRQV